MGIFSDIIGHMGLGIDSQTGERVRTKRVPSDDWGNTYKVIERKNPVTGEWERIGDMPSSISGGHY